MIQYTNWEFSPEERARIWEKLKADPAYAEEVTEIQFFRGVAIGHIQLWVEPNLDVCSDVMATEIIVNAREKYCQILALVGRDTQRQLSLFGSITEWARKNGCIHFKAQCAAPQMRLFARYGFKPSKMQNVIKEI